MENNPLTYILLSGILLLFSSKQLIFINVFCIIHDYYKFIKNNKLLLLFVIIPMPLANAMNLSQVLNQNMIDTLMIIITLLVSIFFSYISFYSEYNFSSIKDQKLYSRKKTNVEECMLIINYNVLISTIILLMCLISPVVKNNAYSIFIFSWIVYYFFIQVILNLMIILKRHSIFK